MTNESVGSVSLDLILNSEEFNNKLNNALTNASNNITNKVNKSLVNTNSLLGKIGKVAAGAFAVSSISKFTKEALNLGSALEETRSMSKVVFGDMYDSLDNWANKSIESMGLSETSAKKYASTLASIFKSAGGSGQGIYDMSTNLTQLAADMASFHNLENTGEAFEKIKAGLVGSSEPLLSLGIDLREGAVEAYALSNGLTSNYKALSNLEKMQIRYQALLSQTKDLQGDFIRNQNSYAVQTSILSQNISKFMANIGQGLLNIVTPAIRALNVLMSKLQVFGEMFANFTAKLFGKAENTTFTTNITDGLSDIVDTAGVAGNALGGVADAAVEASKKASKQVFGFDELTTIQEPQESSSGSSGGTGGGLGDISGGLAEVTSATEEIINKETILDKILNKFKDINFSNLKASFENLKASIMPIVDVIGNGLKWVWDNVLVPFGKWTIEEALPSSIDVLSGAFELIGKVAENVGPKLQSIWDNFLSPIMGFVGDAIVDALDWIAEGLKKVAENETAVDLLGDLVIAFGGIMLYSKVSSIVIGVATAISTLGTSLKVLSTGGLLNSTTLFGKLANVLSLVGGKAATLHEAMILIFGKIGTVVGGIGAIIGGAILAVKNFFDMWQNGWNLLDGILTAIGIAIAAVGAIILGAPAAVTAVIAAIIAVVANLVVIIKDNWDSIWTFTKNIFSAIGNFFVECWNGIVEFGKSVITSYLAMIKRNWELTKEVTMFVFNFIKDFFVSCWNNIKNFFTVTIPAIVNFAIEKWTLFKEKVSNLISVLKDFIINTWTNIKNNISTLISAVVNFGKQQFENFKNGLVIIFNFIKNTILTVFETVGTFVVDKVTFLKEKALSGFNLIKDGASNIFNSLKDIVSNIFSNLVDLVKSPINSIIKLVNNAIDGINGLSGFTIPDWLPGGGGTIGFSLPKIPELASGGYIGANQPTLAMVGDNKHYGEIVAPENKLRQIEAEGSAETNELLRQLININLQILNKNQDINLDGYQLATITNNINARENKRRGW